MGKVRRRFDAKYKEEIAKQILSGVSVQEVCREHQLHHQTVDRWVEKYQAGSPLSGASTREKMLAKQNEKLLTKIGQMAVEIDLLKKVDESIRRQRKENGSVITSENLAQFRKAAKP